MTINLADSVRPDFKHDTALLTSRPNVFWQQPKGRSSWRIQRNVFRCRQPLWTQCCRRAALLFAFCGALIGGLSVEAKSPVLNGFYPGGLAIGGSSTVTALGSFEHWPPQVWSSAPEALRVEPLEESGKLRVSIAETALPGRYWIRLHDADGASSQRPFLVGRLSELVEQEPNDAPTEAQSIAAAATVNGRLGKNGDVDTYAVSLRRGQALVAALEANHLLASPMDATLQVTCDQGFVLDEVDDTVGLDPRLVFVAPRDAVYLVRAYAFPSQPNSSIRFSGGLGYVYRLTLTTGPFAAQTFPLVVRCGEKASLEWIGWNVVPSCERLAVSTPAGASQVTVAPPEWANWVSVQCEPFPSVVEAQPHGDGYVQTLEFPVNVSGRIVPAGDEDVFRIAAQKEKVLSLQLFARRHGSPLDAVVRVTDASGKQLERVDDSVDRDVEVDFVPPADGDYLIKVTDLYRSGSPRHCYRLRVAPVESEFRLRVGADHFRVERDKALEIPVTVERRHGFSEAISVGVEELPEGLTSETVVSAPKGESAKQVKVKVTVDGATEFSGPIRVVGRSGKAGAGLRLERFAVVKLPGANAESRELWLATAPRVDASR